MVLSPWQSLIGFARDECGTSLILWLPMPNLSIHLMLLHISIAALEYIELYRGHSIRWIPTLLTEGGRVETMVKRQE